MKMFLLSLVSFCSAFPLFADPAISDVTVRQRWPWSRLVDIDYVLTGDATNRIDVTLTATDGGKALNITSPALSGDRVGVTPGLHRIVWDPAQSGYTNDILTKFTVSLSAKPSPSYMIVDLATGEKTYRYDSDVWYDVTNGATYKTDKLVFRRICAGTFTMGSYSNETERQYVELLAHPVTLTKDYWLSVFELTQQQYANVMTSLYVQTDSKVWPASLSNLTCRATRPLENVSYLTMRGSSQTRFDIASGTFLAQLRALSGLTVELPTEAEWEYACRAGTMTSWYNSNVDSIMRYRDNGGQYSYNNQPPRDVNDTVATAAVGSYLPNAWGMYDMLGNVWELTLDQFSYEQSTAAAVNPCTLTSGILTIRGGCFDSNTNWSKCFSRSNVTWGSTSVELGFRIYAEVE